MLTDQSIRKFFKGQAVAVGGRLQQPFDEAIPSQASAAIPVSGGVASARVEGFNHREIVTFKNAYTLISGKEADGKLETLVTTVVEGLNILGVVTADRIVARLSGFNPIAPKTNPVVTPSGSYFQNLRVEGEEVTCRFVGSAFDYVTCDAKYLDALDADKDLSGLILPRQDWGEKGFRAVSLCADPKIGQRGCTGPFIDVRHFGRIFLSEFVVSRTSHSLTMLRVELGCAAKGSVSAGSVEGEPFIMP